MDRMFVGSLFQALGAAIYGADGEKRSPSEWKIWPHILLDVYLSILYIFCLPMRQQNKQQTNEDNTATVASLTADLKRLAHVK